MSQHDLNIENQLFPAFRTDLNNALQALGSSMSGSVSPAVPSPGMLWLNNGGSPWRLLLYDGADWIPIAEIDPTTNESYPQAGTSVFDPRGVSDNLVPDADASRDLGSAAARWRTLHARTLDGVTNVNGGPLAGFRNAIINGGFAVAQRGTSYNPQPGLNYGASDRFYLFQADGVGGEMTVSRQQDGDGGFCARIGVNDAVALSGVQRYGQIIEGADISSWQGATVTLSFGMRKSAQWGEGVSVFLQTGTVADEGAIAAESGAWTGLAVPINQTIPAGTLTTAWQRFEYSATLASNIHAAAFRLNWADPTAVGAYIEIRNVQLEIGSRATVFERRPIALETAACERYAPVRRSSQLAEVIGVGGAASGNAADCFIPFSTTRVAPTGLVVSSPEHFSVSHGGVNSVCQSLTFASASTRGAFVSVTLSTSALSTGGAVVLFANTPAAQIEFTGSEL